MDSVDSMDAVFCAVAALFRQQACAQYFYETKRLKRIEMKSCSKQRYSFGCCHVRDRRRSESELPQGLVD